MINISDPQVPYDTRVQAFTAHKVSWNTKNARVRRLGIGWYVYESKI